jgi:hypothetical protein
MVSNGSRSYGGAQVVSTIFKVAAVLLIVGGIISAISVAHNNSVVGSQNTGGDVVGILGGTVFGAAAVLFFAYVLDLLLGIQQNTIRATVAPSSLSAPVIQRGVHVAPRTTPADQVVTTRRAPAYPEPGWYDDPQGSARTRLWDGREWTDRTQT